VEAKLWTPLGLRSLARGEPGYTARYEGGPEQRDAVYHQGTAWAWLLGPFVDAWVRVRGGTREAKAQARARFLAPLLALDDERARLAQNQAVRREIEKELAMPQGRLPKFKGQLMEVKTQPEYQAIQKENDTRPAAKPKTEEPDNSFF